MIEWIRTTERFVVKAVVFDMDGLMFDSERLVQYSWDIAGEQLGYGPLGHNIYHTLGMGTVSRERYFKQTYGDDFPYETFRMLYREAFLKREAKQGIPVKRGLLELLDYLKTEGIPAAMATSTGKKDAMKRVNQIHAAGYFQAIVTGDMVTETKPSPEIYQKALQTLGIAPEDASHTIALEDACNGILSAYAAGMKPVMIPDLQQDSTAVDAKLFAKMGSLEDVLCWMKEVKTPVSF